MPDFLRASWPALSDGGFTGLSWHLVWFGTDIRETQGTRSSVFLSKDFDVGDIRLHVELYTPKHGWERSYFSRTLAEKFFLLLQMDLWIKLGSVRSTFEQTARMSVFLQHDIKNMLQLTSLAADQLMTPVPGQETRLLDMLKRSLPALQERADRILKRLVQSSEVQLGTRNKSAAIDLKAFIGNALDLHGLPAQLDGPDCFVLIAPDSFQSILDNLLGNYVQQIQSGNSIQMPQLRVSWQIHLLKDRKPTRVNAETLEFGDEPRYVLIRLYDSNGQPCLKPERLFEPFWSEHGKGRGIGLFQSRQLATQWGGAINIEAPADGPLVFKIELPAKV
ncbi:MAG: HAMP domain-containing sensor histidine kinase [Pseudohongiella sp.]|nr:HAMP domain-containing sensor histidine kinase [Pseudohongiella sp.]